MIKEEFTCQFDSRKILYEMGFLVGSKVHQKMKGNAFFRLSEDEVDGRLIPSFRDIMDLSLVAVENILRHDYLLYKMGVPVYFWDAFRESWYVNERPWFVRADFVQTDGCFKLLNWHDKRFDGLIDAALLQKIWIGQHVDQLAVAGFPGLVQYNNIHHDVVCLLKKLVPPGGSLNVIYHDGHRGCDCTNFVKYLTYCAGISGIPSTALSLSQANLLGNESVYFAMPDSVSIESRTFLAGKPRMFGEPAWVSLLSNPCFLAILWDMFPHHSNLFPAGWLSQGESFGDGFRYDFRHSVNGCDVIWVDLRSPGHAMKEVIACWGVDEHFSGFMIYQQQSKEGQSCFSHVIF
jgi:glutathionylspermidine synthase